MQTFVSSDTTLDFGLIGLAAEVVKVFLKLSGVVGGVSILLVTLFVSSPLHTNLIRSKRNDDYYHIMQYTILKMDLSLKIIQDHTLITAYVRYVLFHEIVPAADTAPW